MGSLFAPAASLAWRPELVYGQVVWVWHRQLPLVGEVFGEGWERTWFRREYEQRRPFGSGVVDRVVVLVAPDLVRRVAWSSLVASDRLRVTGEIDEDGLRSFLAEGSPPHSRNMPAAEGGSHPKGAKRPPQGVDGRLTVGHSDPFGARP